MKEALCRTRSTFWGSYSQESRNPTNKEGLNDNENIFNSVKKKLDDKKINPKNKYSLVVSILLVLNIYIYTNIKQSVRNVLSKPAQLVTQN